MKKSIDRISPEALAVNQKIVEALQTALDEYKGDKLTARLINLVKKHLPEGQFYCRMGKDNRFGWYEINISPVDLADFYVDPKATFREEREGKSFYAVRLVDNIYDRPDWRESFRYMIDRFNDMDGYEWEQNREPYLDEFEKLEQQANEIKAKAEALMASIPKPEHDPLGRYSHITDWELYRAFPGAFQHRR